jgi:phosphoglycerate dehydrogenase-like enzyme
LLLLLLLLQAQGYSVDQLHQLMAASDYICISLPHTPSTEGLVGSCQRPAVADELTSGAA